ncbi:MAG TPA: hypothetical protein VEF76_02955 [Patescibacteria group bacterium]|nr:hypothetical protein [Patescibacteria group bacterium]
MSLRKKLGELFGDKQGAAIKRVYKKIASGAEWKDIADDVFPKDNKVGAPVGAVVNAILLHQRFDLLTPIAAEAGDWIGLIDLVYRKGEFGPVPAVRAQELEEIYTALKAAPKHGKKLAASFVETVENWTCQRDFEAGYDWAKTKPEFVPVPPLGLAALAEKPIDGRPLAMKVLNTPAQIARAREAAEWVESGHDRDDAVKNLRDWQEKLAKKPPPAPTGPVF